MSAELHFIASLRGLAADPAARGLLDDAAVLEFAGKSLVLTHDMIVEGVHFLGSDPPEDVAWKLLAVNLSDLAGKGARPVGALLGYSLGDSAWDAAFLNGLQTAIEAFAIPLLGGDTVSAPAGTARSLGLTAIGETDGAVPSRTGARAGDILWVSGTIGDSGAGLHVLTGGKDGHPELVERYRRPQPRLEAGQGLASQVSAMMDISDGLLIDARRLAEASGTAISIDLDCIPISREYLALAGDCENARLHATTAGDDYELLFTASPRRSDHIFALARSLGLALTPIGRVEEGAGLTLIDSSGPVSLPERLGYEH